MTIEERVSLLELQVADLDEDVNFLFHEQVIQDKRLFNLEVTSDEIEDEVESKQFIIFDVCHYKCGNSKH